MKEELFLKIPTIEDEQNVLEFKNAFLKTSQTIAGSGSLEKYDTYSSWLEKTINNLDEKTVGEGRVPATQYLTYRKTDNKLVGMIQLRHHINHDYLSVFGGHIGDCIHPDERNKGYAAEQIKLCLEKAKEKNIDKVLLTCVEDNTASEKSILKAGGVFDGIVTKDDGTNFKRFWIYLDNTRPVLETERLILRNYQINDLEDYFKYVSNPNVGPRCGWQPYTEKQSAKERLYVEMSKLHQFAIVLKSKNQVIGSIELMNTKTQRYPDIDVEPNSKEIGFMLSEDFWGQGIMPEATKSVMKYAFETLNVPAIYISHAEKNLQSGRVQEKLGFKIIGKLENYRNWTDGLPTASIMRKMTKAEWLVQK